MSPASLLPTVRHTSPRPTEPAARVTVGQEVGSASGDVTGLQVGRLVGDVAIDTINQIQARIIGGPEAADWLRQSAATTTSASWRAR
ncbi:MAG: hypothetical protein WKH64_04525 [Chloroflexia bacterium]